MVSTQRNGVLTRRSRVGFSRLIPATIARLRRVLGVPTKSGHRGPKDGKSMLLKADCLDYHMHNWLDGPFHLRNFG